MERSAEDTVITRADVLFAGCEFERAMAKFLALMSRVTKRLGRYVSRYEALSFFLANAASDVRVHARTLSHHQVGLGEMILNQGLVRCREEMGDLKVPHRAVSVDELYASFDLLLRTIDHLMVFYKRYGHLVRDKNAEKFIECVLTDWESKKETIVRLLKELPRERMRCYNHGPAVVFEIH